MVALDEMRLSALHAACTAAGLKADRIYNQCVAIPVGDGIAVIGEFQLGRIGMILIQENVAGTHFALGENKNLLWPLNDIEGRRGGHKEGVGESPAILRGNANDLASLLLLTLFGHQRLRSEERRVGKEVRSRRQ